MNQPTQQSQPVQPPPSVPAAPVEPQPAVAASQAAVQKPIQVPAKEHKTKIPKMRIDWLFILAALLVIAHSIALCFLNSSRSSYLDAKKAEADRVQVIQNATTFSQEDIRKLEDSFLTKEGIVDFIQTMQGASAWFTAFDLQLTSDIPQGKDIKYLPFIITLEGDRDDIESFLSTLLTSSYVIEPEVISIENEDPKFSNFALNFSAKLYVSEKNQ